MIITLKNYATEEQIKSLQQIFIDKGCQCKDIIGVNKRIFGVIGDTSSIDPKTIEAFKFVENVTRIAVPFKKVSRQFHPNDTIIEVNGIKIGGNNPIVFIGGPCSIESEESTLLIANGVKKCGGNMLRGGAYKPRTSPYAFQGLQTAGILAMVQARKKTGLPIVSEIMSADKIDEFVENVDIIQVGARNMQNFELLKALGKIDKPILLKRGLANTIEEWLMSAEYILAGGNEKVILCERGIRTFEKYTRNTLDLSVVPLVKKLTHLPIIIDPSHATGKWDLVEAMSLASVAAGCDGLIIEVHNDPEHALSDGPQTLTFENFEKVVEKCKKIAEVIGR